jgi:hypothetical protein
MLPGMQNRGFVPLCDLKVRDAKQPYLRYANSSNSEMRSQAFAYCKEW